MLNKVKNSLCLTNRIFAFTVLLANARLPTRV